MQRAPVPAAKTAGWNANPIDAFLASAMEAKGLKPSAPADRRTLIRRVYLDVLGLPPTPEEVEAFVADKSPAGLAEGRRRGARVAGLRRALGAALDGSGALRGLGGLRVRRRSRPRCIAIATTWSKSFNKDKPYDQFVERATRRRRVRAGHRRSDDRDRLPAARARRAAATRQDALDDLIATTSLTFIGLTVGLRALPQPQVRSDPAEGLLPHPVGLRADDGSRAIRWRRPDEVGAQPQGDAAHRRAAAAAAREQDEDRSAVPADDRRPRDREAAGIHADGVEDAARQAHAGPEADRHADRDAP